LSLFKKRELKAAQKASSARYAELKAHICDWKS